MMIPYRAAERARNIGGHTSTGKDRIMKWETPAAVDFRFGMEITMYVSNR